MNLKEAKANKEKTYTILQNTRVLKNNYIEQLTEEEKNLQIEIEEYTKAFADVENQINQKQSECDSLNMQDSDWFEKHSKCNDELFDLGGKKDQLELELWDVKNDNKTNNGFRK